MARHVVDQGHSAQDHSARSLQYVRKDRHDTPHQAAKSAQRSDRIRGRNARLKAYARIEREQS